MRVLALLLFLVLTAPARAGLDPRLESAGWSLLTLPGERAATFGLAEDGAIRIEANDAVGFLYRVPSGAEAAARRLSFAWRVEAAAPATDLAQREGDDRSLAVHLWFPPARQGPLGFLKRAVGLPLVGEMLTYVHGGTAPAGTIAVNPHYDQGRLITLRTGEGAGWQDETIDFAADYERAFGRPAPALAYIALSADTDATGASARGFVRDLEFSAP